MRSIMWASISSNTSVGDHLGNLAQPYEWATPASMRQQSYPGIGLSGCWTTPEGSRPPQATPNREPDRSRERLPGAYSRCDVAPDIGTLSAVREQLCYVDAYARSVATTVAAVEPGLDGAGAAATLASTVFYPGGGGQPADRGWLRGADGRTWTVASARKSSGDIVHELEPGAEPPAVGEALTAEIDWLRRHTLMRTHTALHALCGVVWRDYGALVTGGNMEPGSGRMDFEFERMSGELVGEIEATVNHELSLGREIRVRSLPRAEAFAIPDLIRTKINLLPPGIDEIRTVEIVGLDLQADGGTHVANTREVGGIRVTGYESKGRINKRIRIELVDP